MLLTHVECWDLFVVPGLRAFHLGLRIAPMTDPEVRARQEIDRQLQAAGWIVQDREHLNLYAGPGVAVREFPVEGGTADYVLFVQIGGQAQAVGIVEAKPEGTTLSGVAEQAAQYAAGWPANLPHVSLPLPFQYESTGAETYFRDNRDLEPRSRRVFTFHRPETLAEWAQEPDTLRGRWVARLISLPEKVPDIASPEVLEGLRSIIRGMGPYVVME